MSIFEIPSVCTWSEWLGIDHYSEIDSLPGVYGIRLLDSTNHLPVPINRLLGKDEDGLLAIGESKDLRQRIKLFYKVTIKRRELLKHSAGDRLFLNLIFSHVSSNNNFFKNKTLQVSFTKADDKKSAQGLEELLMKVYFIQFGELPPLNSSMPGKGQKLWEEALLLMSPK